MSRLIQRRPRRGATLAATALMLASAMALAGCTSDDEGGASSSEDGLPAAQSALEETSGVQLRMATKRLPADTDGFLVIDGVLTDGPAFDGTVKVRVNDITEDLPMRVVDGAVYSQLPYTDVFAEIDPASYGTPDVAELMDPELGLAGWLGDTKDAQADGDTVSGTLAGSTVAQLIESADPKGSFEAQWQLEDDRVTGATLTGPFYKGAKDVTYTLELSQYDVNEDIRRPDVAP